MSSLRSEDAARSSALDSNLARITLALADQAVVSLTNCLTIVLLIWYCEAGVFGAFALAWQLLNYFRTAQERMILAPYLAFVHNPSRDKPTLLGSSLAHNFGFSLALALITALVAWVLFLQGWLPEISRAMLGISLAIPTMLWRDHLRAVSMGNLRSDLALVMDCVGAVVQFALLGWMIFANRMDVWTICGSLAIASLIPVLVWNIRNPIAITFSKPRFLVDWILNWDYAKWLVIGRCFGVASYLIVPWMIALWMGKEETGAFAGCLTLVGLSFMFVQGLNGYFQPLAVQAYHQGGTDRLIHFMWRSFLVYSLVLGPLCVFYYFFGAQLLSLIFRPAYAAFGHVVFVLGLNVWAVSIAIVASNGLAAINRPEGNFFGELANFATAVVLAFILIGPLGLVGGAISISMGSAMASAVTLYSFGLCLKQIKRKNLA